MTFGIDQVAASLPAFAYALPFFGVVNFSPLLFGVGIFMVALAVFKVLQSVVIARLQALSRRTRTDIDDALIDVAANVRTWVFIIIAFYLALIPLSLPAFLDTAALVIFLFAVAWQTIEAGARLIDFGAQKFLEKDSEGGADPNATTASHMVALLSRIVLWSLGGLFVLSNLGIEITSLVAGLGIGGIAVAFALQGILSDLFSSFSIYFDKPFRIGDFIVVGEHSGTVERIGIKTTRIRTLQGEELVVSNAELTAARVQNFKKMDERRIVFSFGIAYETPQEDVRRVPQMVKALFEGLSGVRLDRVHFTSFGDFALLFEVVYFVQSADYEQYMDVQQQINFALMEAFEQASVEFAYPTQTLYVKKAG